MSILRTYLSHGLEDVPFAIIGHGGAATRDHEMLLRVFAARESGNSLDNELLDAIKIRPHLIADILRNQLLRDQSYDYLLKISPAMLFRVVSIDITNLLPLVWPTLSNDLESIERLVAVASERSVPLPSSKNELLGMLRTDPNRYYRVISSARQAEELSNLIATANVDVTPAKMFFLLRLSKTALAPSSSALRSNEEYSFLTAKLLRDRGASQDDIQCYIKELKSPRWVFHALRDGLASSDSERDLVRRLLSAPEWLVEWMQRSRMGEVERNYWFGQYNETDRKLKTDVDLWRRSSRVAATLGEMVEQP